MKLREEILKSKFDDVFVTNTDENIRLAKQELLEMIMEHLPNTFPDKFEAREGGIYNKMCKSINHFGLHFILH